ncbi:MAG: PspC domain-containing protein [Novosphingobium sp.]|uniref:PspC domain-containing protein n=1 Tax=Novosphingobium sp. TaxID=1874826 RepID=UPI0032BAA361
MTTIEHKDTNMNTRTGFQLDKSQAKFMGVCGGIANHFGLDVTLVRIGFALGTVFGFGSLILVYLAIGLIAD